MEVINVIRPYLEMLYFISGIVLAAVGIIALKQLQLAKYSLKIQSKRDALKLTANECKIYFDKIIPLQNAFNDAVDNHNIIFFKDWRITINGNNIEVANKNNPNINEIKNVLPELVDMCNSMEAFATYFISGVADEYIAYHSVGKSFINNIDTVIPWVTHCNGRGHYKHLLSLYVIWKTRSEKARLRIEKDRVENDISKLGEKAVFTVGVDEA